nr:MAG TPA: hypothetical protein [Caudoviricetes sp.]
MNRSVTINYTPVHTSLPNDCKVSYDYLNPEIVTFNLPIKTDLAKFMRKYGLDVLDEIYRKRGQLTNV